MNRSNKEFAIELSKRTRKLAFNIIQLSSSIRKGNEGSVIRYQITKSGCSIGANYREANCSRSKADFRSRIKICHSESNETVYWLEVIEDQSWVDQQIIDELKKEVNSLGAIFATIDKNL